MSLLDRIVTIDANEATAAVAHRLSEVIAIYPITPSSAMGELADEWSSHGQTNLWGQVPQVVEMQSEAGAAGAVHGALQSGALATTFTASQGLLLMIPTMYKIAGELTPFCMHVAARTVATHALSIFGDHSDVMACRQTGFAMLAAGSVQEAQDFAAIAHAATLQSRVPFMHFFDGFRTSHEVAKIVRLDEDTLRLLIDEALIAAHRARGLSPDHPVVRGTAQNPDVFFQCREAANSFYDVTPAIVADTMRHFAEITGRSYELCEYSGHPDAEHVVVLMGSGAETAHETVDWLVQRGERVGVLKVRLFRPFPTADFLAALPRTVRSVVVLDRTKEPGAVGEPLYLDVVATLAEAAATGTPKPRVIGGRYGLSSKEFTPAMMQAIFEESKRDAPINHFTIGITDDVTHRSLPFDRDLDIEPPDVFRAIFFGLGADGTVGANKNSIKIIGAGTSNFAQGYFVYDSKKSGAMTISHLRFGPRPIRSAYLIRQAQFVACHQFEFLDRYDVVECAAPGAVLLLNSRYSADQVWDHLPREVQEQVIAKHLHLYTIDAYAVAQSTGMGRRINTIMQTCFFAVSGVLPRQDAIDRIKETIRKTYEKKGTALVEKNFAAVDATLAHLHEVALPAAATATRRRPPTVAPQASDFVQRVTATILAGHGDLLPVSAFPVDGTWPTGTSKWEKRNIATEIPVWDAAVCIQCNKCTLVCPHAAIRAKVYPPQELADAPTTFKSVDYRGNEYKGWKYTIQGAPEDCTGCQLCAVVCPAKDKANPRHKALEMQPQAPLRDAERDNFAFFLGLPEVDRRSVRADVKAAQFLEPLFEFSGACAGCGETPYIKLLTQLFGDRIIIANATGCSSIYGGNLPTTPYTTNREGRGPAWANSLFEDNAEFGLGIRLGVTHQTERARWLLRQLSSDVGDDLVTSILGAEQRSDAGIAEQRRRVLALRQKLGGLSSPLAGALAAIADYLVRKSVWIVGGDGWAYDIGFGGLDHVLALGHDVNLLVLDTEVYSNTGGQQSKATPLGAAAKFASSGKATPKKDLGLIAMTYGHAYVARLAFGAKDLHTTRSLLDADAYPGPSLLIAYSPCIAHGYDLAYGVEQQKLAVQSGYWPIYHFDPRRGLQGESPLQLDSAAPSASVKDFAYNETRFRMVEQLDPQRFRELMAAEQREVTSRFAIYEQLAKLVVPKVPSGSD